MFGFIANRQTPSTEPDKSGESKKKVQKSKYQSMNKNKENHPLSHPIPSIPSMIDSPSRRNPKTPPGTRKASPVPNRNETQNPEPKNDQPIAKSVSDRPSAPEISPHGDFRPIRTRQMDSSQPTTTARSSSCRVWRRAIAAFRR